MSTTIDQQIRNMSAGGICYRQWMSSVNHIQVIYLYRMNTKRTEGRYTVLYSYTREYNVYTRFTHYWLLVVNYYMA